MKTSLFWNLVSFEYKKILRKKSSIIVLVIVTLLAITSVFGTLIGNEYTMEGDVVGTRYEAMIRERDYARALAGRPIDQELLMEAASAAVKTPDNDYDYLNPENAEQYYPIFSIACMVYNDNLEEFSQTTPEKAEQFYEIRNNNFAQDVHYMGYSEKISEELIAENERVATPFIYEYYGGYERYMVIMYSTMFTVLAAIAILFAPLFSGEYTCGADSLILSSKYGKGIDIKAKLFVLFSFSLGYAVIISLLSLVESLAVFGPDGANAILQLFYPSMIWSLTMWQAFVVYTICLFGACIFTGALTSALSAWFKTPFATIVIMAVVIIVPMFINISEYDALWYSLFSLFPSNMIAIWYTFSSDPFVLFGQMIKPYYFMPVFSLIMAMILSGVSFFKFKNHEVG